MNFDFSEDQKFVQKTARDYLTEHSDLVVCRAVLESEQPYDRTLWKGVAEMGWLGTAIPESYGGAGLGYLELVLIAEEIGRALAPIPFSSSVYLATEAILRYGSEDAEEEVPAAARVGRARSARFALAEGPGDIGRGVARDRASRRASSRGDEAPGADGDVAGLAVVVGEGRQRDVPRARRSRAAPASRGRPIESFDPCRSLASVALRRRARPSCSARKGRAADAARADPRPRRRDAWPSSRSAAPSARFDITRDFTPRPLRVRPAHRVVPGAEAPHGRPLREHPDRALERATTARGRSRTTAPELAAAAAARARVAASEAFELAGEEMIQMHGGVGFTWEYDCHLFYRRAQAASARCSAPPPSGARS